MIRYASHKTRVMVGKSNSVLNPLVEKQPTCHLSALCCSAALKNNPVSLDNLFIDRYYYLKHSAKRWHMFNKLQSEFSNARPLSVLKHCTTYCQLWCGKIEYLAGTEKEHVLFKSVRIFYETSVLLNINSKFPFKDQAIKDLSLLYPRNSENTSVSGIIQLAIRFTSFSSDDLDCLSMEFRYFHYTPMDQLPAYDSLESGAIDHF